MTDEQQLKLQAFSDGELPEAEAREVAALIARDAEAAKLHAELKNTRLALKGFDAGIALPESREFFWSKIQRGIERSTPSQSVEESASVFTVLRRWLMAAGAVALLLVAGLFAMKQLSSSSYAAAPETVTELADAGAVTYHNYETSTTLVWFSYPANQASANGATAIQ